MSKELIVSSTAHETKVAIIEDDQVVEVYFEREQEYSLAGSIFKGRVTRVLPGMQSAFVNIGLERDAFLYVSDFFEDTDEYDALVSATEEKVARLAREGTLDTLEPPGAPSVIPISGAAVFSAGASAAPAVAPSAGEAPDSVVTETPVLEPPTEAIALSVDAAVPVRPAGPPSAPVGDDRGDRDRHHRRNRRRRGKQRGGFPESKYAGGGGAPRPTFPPVSSAPAVVAAFESPVAEDEEVEAHEEETPRIPILLPGESLAKYRGLGSEPVAEAQAAAAESGSPPPEVAQPIVESESPVVVEVEADLVVVNNSNDANNSEVVIFQEAAPTEVHEALAEVHEEEPKAIAPVVLAADVQELPSEIGPLAGDVKMDPGPTEEAAKEPVPEPVPELVKEASHEEIASDEAGLAETFAAGESAADPDVAELGEESATEAGEESRQEAGEEPSLEESEDACEETGDVGHEGESDEAGQDLEQAPKADATAVVRGPAPERRFNSRRNRRRGRDQRPQPNQNRQGLQSQQGPPRPPAVAGPPPEQRPVVDRDSRPTRGQPLIGELLHEGQEIIVQVAKEPIGKKGARITSHIALPGRYLVYMPTVDHVGVSRRISSDEERQRLKRVLSEFRRGVNMPGGFIVRTAAEGHSDEDLRADMRFLFNLWKECRSVAEKKSAPLLLHRDLNLVERILRDQVSSNFTTIWVDDEAQYAKIVEFAHLSQPSLAGRVKLYGKDTPIFEEFGVQEQINNAMKSKVWLKSGGHIVINQTEALVAIDVNTGKFVGKTQRLEDTIVKTNVDAIKEIVRQIRLRDLGGIIVIDFIDMDERKNRQRVMQALEEALRKDRAPSKALQFNDFGLVAITRKRVKQPLEKALGCACPYCAGSGFVKSAQTVSLEILAEATKMINSGVLERNTITLRVNPDVARYMKQSGASIIAEIEELAKKPLIVKGDVNLHQENFDIH